MIDRDYKSTYTNEDFYAEYTEGTQTIMILSGDVNATGQTYYEARTYEYPGSVDTSIKDVSFEGTLTLYTYPMSDGINIELSVLGDEALELLEMFKWKPEEYEWEEDESCTECIDY